MTDSNNTTEFFRICSKVLLRCWLIGAVLLVFWAVMAAWGMDWIFRFHGTMFGLTRHELELIFYCGMGLLKLMIIVFFLLPWLAIRLVIGKPNA